MLNIAAHNVESWSSCAGPPLPNAQHLLWLWTTLAAETSASDEGCDRAAYVNLFLSELLYNTPAHRVNAKLCQLAVTDAKSLYDCVISDSPNLSDKRSLVNIRAIQEVVPGKFFHWVPTDLMWADGLTKHSRELQQSLHEWLQQPRVTLRKVS